MMFLYKDILTKTFQIVVKINLNKQTRTNIKKWQHTNMMFKPYEENVVLMIMMAKIDEKSKNWHYNYNDGEDI